MGRDCVSHGTPPPSMAHSRSCGAPKCTSARRPSSSSAGKLGVVQAGLRPGAGLLDPFGSAARQRPDGHPLAPDPALQNLPGGAVDHEMVRVDRPGHHRLAESGAGIDDRLVPPAGHRVRGEQDTGHGGVHHPLDHHGEGHGRGADRRGWRGSSRRGPSRARPSTAGRRPGRRRRPRRSGRCPAGRRSWRTAGPRRWRTTAPPQARPVPAPRRRPGRRRRCRRERRRPGPGRGRRRPARRAPEGPPAAVAARPAWTCSSPAGAVARR